MGLVGFGLQGAKNNSARMNARKSTANEVGLSHGSLANGSKVVDFEAQTQIRPMGQGAVRGVGRWARLAASNATSMPIKPLLLASNSNNSRLQVKTLPVPRYFDVELRSGMLVKRPAPPANAKSSGLWVKRPAPPADDLKPQPAAKRPVPFADAYSTLRAKAAREYPARSTIWAKTADQLPAASQTKAAVESPASVPSAPRAKAAAESPAAPCLVSGHNMSQRQKNRSTSGQALRTEGANLWSPPANLSAVRLAGRVASGSFPPWALEEAGGPGLRTRSGTVYYLPSRAGTGVRRERKELAVGHIQRAWYGDWQHPWQTVICGEDGGEWMLVGVEVTSRLRSMVHRGVLRVPLPMTQVSPPMTKVCFFHV